LIATVRLRFFYDFLSLKKNGNVPSKRKKNLKNFVGILNVTVLTNRVGSVPKCHGAKTLLVAVTSLKTGTV
jgi:hypothetical protein